MLGVPLPNYSKYSPAVGGEEEWHGNSSREILTQVFTWETERHKN